MRPLVAVTGATGFVGAELCRQLGESGAIAVKFRSAAGAAGQSVSGTKALDLMATGPVWASALAGVDTVIHLAALTHESADRSDVSRFHTVNVAGTENLAKAAASAGVKRFIFMSSIKVNGELTCSGSGFQPSDIPEPLTPYGMTKLLAEESVIKICEAHSMDWVIVRAPLVCGVGVKGNLNQLLVMARRGLPMPFGAVNNRRSMVSVVDLAKLLTKCVLYEGQLKRVLLVSDDNPVSTAQLCRWVIDEMKSRSWLFPFPASVLEIFLKLLGRGEMAEKLFKSLVVDNSETKQALDWEPEDGVEAAIRRMAAECTDEAKPV